MPTSLGNILAAAILGVIVFHFWHLRSERRFLVFDPINTFWAGILVCYVLQAFEHGATFIQWHSEGTFELTLFATLVGVVFVVIGYEIKLGVQLGNMIPELPKKLDQGRTTFAALALFLIGVGTYYLVMIKSGGVQLWLSTGRGGTDYEVVRGYWPALTECLTVGTVLLLLITRLHHSGTTLRVVAWSLTVCLLLWFVYLGSRSRTIMVVVQSMCAVYLPRRRSPPVWLMAIGLLVLLPLMRFQGNYRHHFTNLSFNLSELDAKEVWSEVLPWTSRATTAQEVSRGGEFDCAMAAVRLVPGEVPYNYGYGLLELFTRPVPRAVWPQKIYPHLESMQPLLREANLSESVSPGTDLLMGPSFCFVGYWFCVGGWIGLSVGGLVVGVLCRTVRHFYDRCPTNHTTILIYPFLLIIGFCEAATTPFYWLFTLPFALLPLLLLSWLCKPSSTHSLRVNAEFPKIENI